MRSLWSMFRSRDRRARVLTDSLLLGLLRLSLDVTEILCRLFVSRCGQAGSQATGRQAPGRGSAELSSPVARRIGRSRKTRRGRLGIFRQVTWKVDCKHRREQMANFAKAPPDGPLGAYRNLTSEFMRRRDASRAHTRPFMMGAHRSSSEIVHQ